jgi:uncharacterized protein (TIGR03086 family)
MPTRDHVHSVVESVQSVVDGVSDPDTSAASPCPDWDVRSVANHLLGTIEAMRRVGAGEDLDPEDPWGTQGDHARETWRSDLSDLLASYAETWSRPESWEGAAMGGKVPRQMIGDMGFVEVVLHGWDLARGSGQQVQYDDAAIDQALEVMAQIGEQGRSQGAFGAEVPLPDDAPPFHRVLAQSGRDPRWASA